MYKLLNRAYSPDCHPFAGGNFILCQIQKMACTNTLSLGITKQSGKIVQLQGWILVIQIKFYNNIIII